MRWPAAILLVIAAPLYLGAKPTFDDWVSRDWGTDIRQEWMDEYLSEAVDFLAKFDRECSYYNHVEALASYTYETNITKANSDKLSSVSMERSKWYDVMLARAKQFNTAVMNDKMKRMFKIIKMNSNPKDLALRKKLDEYGNQLVNIYSSARVCRNSKCYAGETDLVRLYADPSTDYDTLLWAWKAWRDATGPKMKNIYKKMVDGMNTGARDNGYPDESVPWMLFEMDDRNLNVTALRIWDRVKPLYEQLHAYVRYHLMKRYPGKLSEDGPIPEHLLGNVWGQEWDHIYDFMVPYPEVPLTDVTAEMRRQKYDVRKIFTTAESFFTSIGLPKMTRKFWKNSLLEDPRDGRVVQCHASAEDMFDKEKTDFRIKMCTTVTEYDLMTAHHEMGHVEYYMIYRDQPCVYRTGANAAFHEAVGDTMQLSAMTPHYLQKIGLSSGSKTGSVKTERKRSINFLLRMALKKVSFLPYGLMVDSWRWGVFNGQTPPSRYNHDWWKLRIGLGGVMPPVDRSENDFDPGSKYHIASNTRYIRYFFSFLMQFQFHRSLCDISGHRGPIHQCDISGSKEAGQALRSMLSLGQSIPWPDTLEKLTGQRAVDPEAILQYFKPLYDWLVRENRKNGATIGWRTNNIGVKW